MSSSIPIVRRAGPADAAALAEIGAATFTQTFGHLYSERDLQAFLLKSRSVQRYAALLADPDIGAWLAGFPDAPAIGYALVGRCKLPVKGLEPTAGEVQELYVRADAQGLRLGTGLLTTALEWLRSCGRQPIYIGVWSENLGAQRLYGRFGFARVGEYGFPVGDHVDHEFILKGA